MAVYIGTFLIVTGLFRFAEKVKKNQRHILEYSAIFLLCLVAGLRAESVGTDTALYLRPCIESAISSNSFQQYMADSWSYEWHYRAVADYEIGFVLTNYVTAKLFHSVAVSQFVIQLLIIAPVYAALKRRKEIPVWFGMLVYLLVFYNLSLNMIRQSVAMSFCLLAVQFWMEGKRRKTLLYTVISVLFHSSGILGIGIILIYEFVQKDRKKALRLLGIRVDARYANMVIMILAGLAVLFGANTIASILRMTPLGSYAGYISGNLQFMPNQLIKLLPPLLIMLYNFKYIEQRTSQGKFFLSLLMISIIALQFTSVNAFGGRIAEYFMLFGVLSYPLPCLYGKNKALCRLTMVGYLMFYWVFYYGIGNSGETIPYHTVFH